MQGKRVGFTPTNRTAGAKGRNMTYGFSYDDWTHLSGPCSISWTSGGIRWVPNGTHIAVGNGIKWAMKVVQWFVRRLTYMPFWCFHVVANPLRNKSGKECRLIDVWHDKLSPLRAQNLFVATVSITILEPGVLVSRGMCHRSMRFLNLHHRVPPQSLLNTIKSL